MTQKLIEREQGMIAHGTGTAVQDKTEDTAVFAAVSKKMRVTRSTGSIDAEQTLVFRKPVKKRVLKKLPQQTVNTAAVRAEIPPAPMPVQEPVSAPVRNKVPAAPAKPKRKKQQLKLSCPAKTIFMSVIFGLWNFLNFFVLYMDLKWQFFASFGILAAVYGVLVLDRWLTRLRYIGISAVIQQVTLLLSWGIFVRHCPEPVTHWTSLMFAVYQLFVPVLGILAAVLMVGAYGAVVGMISAARAKLRRVQAAQAAKVEQRMESYRPSGVEEVLTDTATASEALQNLASAGGQDVREEESSSTVA